MNYTEKYHLPQWAEDDRILMTDFNQMCADIEAGLKAAAGLPYVVGSYTGNGATAEEGGQHIELGFQPRFLQITGMGNGVDASGEAYRYNASSGGQQTTQTLQITETGFAVNYTSGVFPMLNQSGRTYTYIAFQ